MPPPLVVAVFPEIVQLLTVRTVSGDRFVALAIAPPAVAELLNNVLSAIVSVPEL
jgi:hypothetical protein